MLIEGKREGVDPVSMLRGTCQILLRITEFKTLQTVPASLFVHDVELRVNFLHAKPIFTATFKRYPKVVSLFFAQDCIEHLTSVCTCESCVRVWRNLAPRQLSLVAIERLQPQQRHTCSIRSSTNSPTVKKTTSLRQ